MKQEQGLENNPRFLIITIDEYIEASKKVAEKSGVMVGIVAAVATALLLSRPNNPLPLDVAIYSFWLPFIFLIGAIIYYVRTFIRNNVYMPLRYIHNKALQDQITFPNPEKDIVEVKKILDRALDTYDKKQKLFSTAHSFILTFVTIEIVTNIVTVSMLRDDLGTDTPFAVATFAVIGLLMTYLTKKHVFNPKRTPFGFSIAINEQNIPGQAPAVVMPVSTAPQPGMPIQLVMQPQVQPVPNQQQSVTMPMSKKSAPEPSSIANSEPKPV